MRRVQKGNETDYQYQTTKLNEQKNYIAFSSWWDDLIVLGIIPLVALLVFNSKIYMKVRGSSKMEYRFVGRRSLRSNRSRDQQHPSQHFSSSSGAKSINGADFGSKLFKIILTAEWSRVPVGILLSIDSREDGREVKLSRSSLDLLRVS